MHCIKRTRREYLHILRSTIAIAGRLPLTSCAPDCYTHRYTFYIYIVNRVHALPSLYGLAIPNSKSVLELRVGSAYICGRGVGLAWQVLPWGAVAGPSDPLNQPVVQPAPAAPTDAAKRSRAHTAMLQRIDAQWEFVVFARKLPETRTQRHRRSRAQFAKR